MMKKLLAVLLVLGMTSASFGALVVMDVKSVNGVPVETTPGQIIDVNPSDMVEVVVVADFDARAIKAWGINDNGLEPALGMVEAPFTVHPNLSLGMTAGAGANANDRLFQANLAAPVNSFQGSAQGLNAPAGEALLSFIYHVPELDPSTIITIDDIAFSTSLPNGATDTAFQTIGIEPLTLHVVPEPMTMSLLGLGGLALLRRRR
jgi:hypothetical protein